VGWASKGSTRSSLSWGVGGPCAFSQIDSSPPFPFDLSGEVVTAEPKRKGGSEPRNIPAYKSLEL